MRRGWQVLLLTTMALSACSSEAGAPPEVAAPTAGSEAPASSGPGGPDGDPVAEPIRTRCRAEQLSAVSVTAEGGGGEPAAGTFTVPFAVVNLGADCALPHRAAFVRARGRAAYFRPTAGAVLIPANQYVVLGLRLFRRHGACVPERDSELPLLFGRRMPSAVPALDVRSVRVPGITVPVSALACGRARLVEVEPAQPTSDDLLRRARAPRPAADVGLAVGLPPGRLDALLRPAAEGIPLPVFCRGSSRFDAGVVSDRVLVSIARRRGTEERELAAWSNERRAGAAYDGLLAAVRGCPQQGQTGVTSELHADPLGQRSFEVVASDVGTGGGASWMRWSVVHRGRCVLVAQVSTFDPDPSPADIGAVVGRLDAACGGA